jgi:homoserine dehydrogenase
MAHYTLALLGFGNVGQALAQLLMRKQDDLKIKYDLSFSITAIGTSRHGSAIDPQGIDLDKVISLMNSGLNLDNLSTQPAPENSLELIESCNADVLFENTPVNYQSGQPALDHLRKAINKGMHAITANKGPVVYGYEGLSALAKSKNKKFFFESAVMDGAPIFSLFRETLPAAHLRGFRGILNSTTNLILNRMEEGEDLEQAVAHAQSIGIAETDPSGDIDGWDAAIKVAALVTVLMGIPIKPTDVDRKGIRGLSSAEIQNANQMGKRWKLVCSVQHTESGLITSVAPEMVSPDSPLYAIDGTTSIIQFETDVLGPLSVIEANPGPQTTAYGLLADFINAVR